jgi:hypothetical protein
LSEKYANWVVDVRSSGSGLGFEPTNDLYFRGKLIYRVIIEKDEDGVLVAKVPDLPGSATEGKTRQSL